MSSYLTEQPIWTEPSEAILHLNDKHLEVFDLRGICGAYSITIVSSAPDSPHAGKVAIMLSRPMRVDEGNGVTRATGINVWLRPELVQEIRPNGSGSHRDQLKLDLPTTEIAEVVYRKGSRLLVHIITGRNPTINSFALSLQNDGEPSIPVTKKLISIVGAGSNKEAFDIVKARLERGEYDAQLPQ